MARRGRTALEWYLRPDAPVAPVRHEVCRYLAVYAGDGALDAINVVVGELLANVVRHAASGAKIDVEWTDGTATITVTDQGPGFEAATITRPNPDAEQGRGLWLVQQLADDVRIAHGRDGGAVVSAQLRIG